MALDSHDLDDACRHEPEACAFCVETHCTVKCQCDCGNCCENLLIEASLRDAEREPRIAGCIPIIEDDIEGNRVLVGYLLNSPENGNACRFFDRVTRKCTIYDTRPLACRVYDCDTEWSMLGQGIETE